MVDLVFYAIGWPYPALADACLRSARRAMPDVRITQLSDRDTPALPGVDRVRRIDPPFRLSRKTIHYAGYHALDALDLDVCLFSDLDMLYAGSVEDIFARDFDVALCPRPARDGRKPRHKARFPYCSAMWVKTRRFWSDCYAVMRACPRQRWTDNMAAVAAVVRSGAYKVLLLDPRRYNRIPRHADDYDPATRIYHFQGGRTLDRRAWMLDFDRRYLGATYAA